MLNGFLQTMYGVLTSPYNSLSATGVSLSIIVGVLVLVAVIWILCMISHEIYCAKAYNYVEKTMRAWVCDKHHESSHITMAGKVPISHPANYKVRIRTHDGLSFVLNDARLYDWAQKGRTLHITIKEGYNRKGDLKDVRIIDYTW